MTVQRRVVNLPEERAYITIRIGLLQTFSLIALKFGTSRMAVVASPAYLEKHAAQDLPEQLASHRANGWAFFRTIGGWPFRWPDGKQALSPPIIARASDGEAARGVAISATGLMAREEGVWRLSARVTPPA